MAIKTRRNAPTPSAARVSTLLGHLSPAHTANSTKKAIGVDNPLYGRGYRAATEKAVLPKLPAGARFDDAMRAKYTEFKDKRRKGEGEAMEQFIPLDEFQAFAQYLEDPYTEQAPAREPVIRDIDVCIVGAGFSGLLTAARLAEVGFTDMVLCEKGGDVGGTW